MSIAAPTFHIDSLRRFSGDGLVYRAFSQLIAARMGALLLVPMHLVGGRIEAVDGCPVPWEEVFAVLEYPVGDVNGCCELMLEWIDRLEDMGIDPSDCDVDHIAPMVNGEEKVLRLVHPCGVRFAVCQ